VRRRSAKDWTGIENVASVARKWSYLHVAEDRLSLFLIGDIHGRIDEYLRLLASEDAKEIRRFAVQPFFED